MCVNLLRPVLSALCEVQPTNLSPSVGTERNYALHSKGGKKQLKDSAIKKWSSKPLSSIRTTRELAAITMEAPPNNQQFSFYTLYKTTSEPPIPRLFSLPRMKELAKCTLQRTGNTEKTITSV